MAPKPKDKSKPSPSPSPSQPPVTIEDLFTNLKRHIDESKFGQAVRVADQVLSIAPGDEDALRCKVVALIKADRIDDALSAIHSAPNRPADLGFFKAYCLYRQNKLDEALESLKGQERNSDTMLLEAQTLSRQGKMDACIDVYQRLQKSKIESLETNLAASLVLAGKAAEVQGMMESNRINASSSFELAYNVACALIERNKHLDAEQLLLTARRVGEELLMDDNFAEDEIEIELAPIAVQLAYVKQLLGQSQEAKQAYVDIINRGRADESSLTVAANNFVTLKGSRDVSDSVRKSDRKKEPDVHSLNDQLVRGLDKLSPKQKEAIYANRVLLLLHANKIDQARELVATLPDMFADSIVPVLLQAAVLVRENKAGKAEEILGQFAEKFPDKSKGILLARAQIAAAAAHHQIAADSLAKISDIQHMPAAVATIVSIKERAGDIDGASAVLDSAINWWSNAMTEDKKLNVIMQEAASFKLRHGREEDAAQLYEELVRSHGSVEALAALVSTVARVDVDKAETYEKRLKPLPGLKGINVDTLEKTSGAKNDEGAFNAKVAEAPEEFKKEKPKKKRKRKPRYPKGFDPANPGPPPDPERWLPKRERSTYRPKRKDKRAAQVRGSQGAVVREKHDAGGGATNPNTSNSKATQASTSKSTSQNTAAEPSKSSAKSSRKKSRN